MPSGRTTSTTSSPHSRGSHSPQHCTRQTLTLRAQTPKHEELLDGLWTAFADRKGPKVCALVGAANIGKTWAAKEFAWRHRTEQDYDVVWWMQAEERITLHRKYAELAERLGLDAADTESRIRRVRNWLTEHERWLLVFDSVKRPEMIEPLLPEGRLKGHVLITTEQGWRDRTAGQVRLGGFSPDEAKHFLLASGDVDPPTAEELARQLNFVPPALAAAVAYVQSGEGLLADYLGFLTSTRDEGGR